MSRGDLLVNLVSAFEGFKMAESTVVGPGSRLSLGKLTV